jgi:hypothetical protein
MRIGKAQTAKQQGRLGGLLSRLRRVEEPPPTQWWKRPPAWMANRVSTVRTKLTRAEPPRPKSSPAASTRRTAALAGLGIGTAGAIALTNRRRNAQEGPPDLPAPTGMAAGEEASEAPT